MDRRVRSGTGLLRLARADLDDLFASHPATASPTGYTRGTAIVCSGGVVRRTIGRVLACCVRLLCWQGKVFDPVAGTLQNRISPFRIRAIRARVYPTASWSDGGPAVVLDYSQTSFVARRIRDEIREVAPGLWLGQVYWGRTRLLDFALEPADGGAVRRSDRRIAIALLLLVGIAAWAGLRFTSDSTTIYDSPAEQFAHGSHGG
ncbi:MAG: hypothetical protein KDE27_33080, partial [Planctomycetes bacterium]|nr:hypothetical protein [Planctomycetota bacterium]